MGRPVREAEHRGAERQEDQPARSGSRGGLGKEGPWKQRDLEERGGASELVMGEMDAWMDAI